MRINPITGILESDIILRNIIRTLFPFHDIHMHFWDIKLFIKEMMNTNTVFTIHISICLSCGKLWSMYSLTSRFHIVIARSINVENTWVCAIKLFIQSFPYLNAMIRVKTHSTSSLEKRILIIADKSMPVQKFIKIHGVPISCRLEAFFPMCTSISNHYSFEFDYFIFYSRQFVVIDNFIS